MRQLENHAKRPEVAAAAAGGVGVSMRPSKSDGDDQLYVAVRAPEGVARVSMPLVSLDEHHRGRAARGDGRGRRRARRRPARGVEHVAGDHAAAASSCATSRARSRTATSSAGPRSTRRENSATSRSRCASSRSSSPRATPRGSADEALLVQLTESLNEGVVGLDASRHVIRINETGRRLLGVRETAPLLRRPDPTRPRAARRARRPRSRARRRRGARPRSSAAP